MAKTQTINVNGTEISLFKLDNEDYLSITDITKTFPDGKQLVPRWIRNRDTLEFLAVWEKLNNPNFQVAEFDNLYLESGKNRFSLSVKRWIETTNAIGFKLKRIGKVPATFAHKDIVLGFCYWLSPPFQLYVIKEFQRLKEEEAKLLQTDWNLKRQISKTNWHIHSAAVREHLVPVIDWNTKKEAIRQASEADLLNLALFGMTAKEWKQISGNKKGNLRDNATTEQLIILSNLQSLNAKLLEWDSPKDQRLEILHKTAQDQMEIIINTQAVQQIKALE